MLSKRGLQIPTSLKSLIGRQNRMKQYLLFETGRGKLLRLVVVDCCGVGNRSPCVQDALALVQYTGSSKRVKHPWNSPTQRINHFIIWFSITAIPPICAVFFLASIVGYFVIAEKIGKSYIHFIPSICDLGSCRRPRWRTICRSY